MRGAALSIAMLLAACSTKDSRPETLAYVTETVLRPYCALTECHSSVRRQSNYVFDTVAAAQSSLAGTGFPAGDIGQLVMPNDATSSPLVYLVDPKSGMPDTSGNYMPYDQPLSNLDIVYLTNWINDGADGFTAP